VIVRAVGIVGAGTTGQGIAIACASAGLDVLVSERTPLALADRMGLDEVMRWMQHLFDELGDLKYRPCPLLRKMVRAGRLGVKAGIGFFAYDEEGRVQAAPPPSPGR
jgi:3-hydroxyacyl-CoA dehydrogenase